MLKTFLCPLVWSVPLIPCQSCFPFPHRMFGWLEREEQRGLFMLGAKFSQPYMLLSGIPMSRSSDGGVAAATSVSPAAELSILSQIGCRPPRNCNLLVLLHILNCI
ncbi:hypothetical protein ILYODFUR_015968 [Ilyodon furcidens]|uniref:Secreted protein n=1 Tax=Ilyodon furcidens TaxID=33524 RepID=A0ABV0TJB1_9TELE